MKFLVIFFCQDFSTLTKKLKLVRTWISLAPTDAKLATKSQQLKVRNLLEQIIEDSIINFFNQLTINSPHISYSSINHTPLTYRSS